MVGVWATRVRAAPADSMASNARLASLAPVFDGGGVVGAVVKRLGLTFMPNR